VANIIIDAQITTGPTISIDAVVTEGDAFIETTIGSGGGGTAYGYATTSVPGIVRMATKSEVNDHSLSSQVVATPASLADHVLTDDERLSDARTPTSHASSHAAAGGDPLTLSTSQVSGLAEFIRDTIGDTLVEGTGVSIDVDDANDEIEISATGGGGSGTVVSVAGVEPDEGGDVPLEASDVGAEIEGAVQAHEEAADPHSQYTTDSDVANAVDAALDAHAEASDPHPTYVTGTELANALSSFGSGQSFDVVVWDDAWPDERPAADVVLFFCPDGAQSTLEIAEENDVVVVDDLSDAVQKAGGNVVELEDSSVPYMLIKVPNDGSDDSLWPSRFEVQYESSPGNFKRTFALNEFGEIRAESSNNVRHALRIHGFSNSHTGNIFVVKKYWGGPDIFTVSPSGVTSSVPITAPNLGAGGGTNVYELDVADPPPTGASGFVIRSED